MVPTSQVPASDVQSLWLPHLALLIYVWCLWLRDQHSPFLSLYPSEILCIVGIGFSHWNLLRGRLPLEKNIGLCHPIKVRMEKAHVSLLRQLYSPLQHIMSGSFRGKVTNGNKYCLILASEDFRPHKNGLLGLYLVFLSYYVSLSEIVLQPL